MQKKDLLARAFVFQTLPEDVKDVWEALRSRYLGVERVQKAKLQTLRTELDMLKMKDGETLDDFSGKLSEIDMKYKSLGSSLEYEVVIRKFFSGVPKKYLRIVASIEQYSKLYEMTLD